MLKARPIHPLKLTLSLKLPSSTLDRDLLSVTQPLLWAPSIPPTSFSTPSPYILNPESHHRVYIRCKQTWGYPRCHLVAQCLVNVGGLQQFWRSCGTVIIQGDFFNWDSPEFAKCWSVSNWFKKTLESHTGPPMIKKRLSNWWSVYDSNT